MSKKSIYDVLLQRSITGLMNISQSVESTKVKLTLKDKDYPVVLPVSSDRLLRVVVRTSDKGNLKIKATLDKSIKRLVAVVVRQAQENMQMFNDGMTDYTTVKPSLWKAYGRKAQADLRSRIIRASLQNFNWTK